MYYTDNLSRCINSSPYILLFLPFFLWFLFGLWPHAHSTGGIVCLYIICLLYCGDFFSPSTSPLAFVRFFISFQSQAVKWFLLYISLPVPVQISWPERERLDPLEGFNIPWTDSDFYPMCQFWGLELKYTNVHSSVKVAPQLYPLSSESFPPEYGLKISLGPAPWISIWIDEPNCLTC